MYNSNLDRKVYWICSLDENGEILSMFFKQDDPERHYCKIPNEEAALEQMNLLIKEGWTKCKQPKINIIQDEKKPNRKERRLQEKKEKKNKN